MLFVFLAALCSIAVLVLLYVWIRHYYSENIRYLRGLPTGLPTLPLLGHIHHVVLNAEGPQTAAMSVLKKISSLHPQLFCLWVGPSPSVFIGDPEDIQVVLNSSKTLQKGRDYRLMKYVLGEGLLTAEVPIWKITRSHMMSLFHPRNLEHLVPLFNRTSEHLVQQISNKVQHEPIDITDDLFELGIRNALCLTFGSKMEDETTQRKINMLRKAIKLGSNLSGARFMKPWLRWDAIFYCTYNKLIHYVVNAIYCLPPFALKQIEECEKSLQKNENNLNFNSKGIPTERNNQGVTKYPITLPEIYKIIGELNSSIKKENLKHELNSMVVTGTDTISITIANCLLALAAHPYVQSMLYNEIVQEVGKEGLIVSSEDVKKLKYMDCVLKESLRLFPTVPFMARTNERAIKLSSCTLPPGTNMVVNMLGVHHNPRLFPDPVKFDPDRFTADNVAQRHKYSFLPFSGGARDCIGKQYAWLMMKIVLVHLLREYRITTTVDITTLKFTFEIITISKGAHQITFKKRNK